MIGVQELMRALINNIKCQDELINYKKLNRSVAESLASCFYYSINTSDQNQSTKKLVEIDSVLDFLHDELNTGHWSDIPLETRRCFSSASYIKCLITLKCSDECLTRLLQKCLKCLDLGLLLGAPLEDNHDLLTSAAKLLTQEINKTVDKNNELAHSEFGRAKRKLEDKERSSFQKLPGKEIPYKDHPSLEYFNKNHFIPQLPIKLRGCMDYWPATKKWLDVNYFLNIAGDRTVPIEVGSHYVDEDWSQQLMTLKEFIVNHYLGKNKNVGYLAQHNLFEQIEKGGDNGESN